MITTSCIVSAVVWTLIAFLIFYRNLAFASGDDYSRVVLGMRWAREHYFFVEGYYWLPLPFWYYGAWCQGLSWIGDTIFWFIPAATMMMFLASWGLMLLTWEIHRPGEIMPGRARAACAFLSLMMALTIPYAWRMTATALAEPVFMAAMTWLALLLVRFKTRPTNATWAGILVLCASLMWMRYEGWLIAFVVWAMACHVRHSVQRRRFQWQLPAGFAVLSILPLVLMAIHARFSMDPLYFLNFPRVFAERMMPEVAHATTWWRIGYLSRLAWAEGWVILPLTAFGLFAGWRVSAMRPYAFLVFVIWLSYYQGAISNTFGTSPPNRFCVPALWMSVPIAATGALWLMRLRPRSLGWLTRTAVAIAVFTQINGSDARNWGGLTHTPEMLDLAGRLAESARERNGYAVIADSDSLGDNINLFRIYMGLDRVVVEKWFQPAGLPLKGEFYYFTPRPMMGVTPAKLIAGQYLYVFDEWPKNVNEE